MFATVVGRATMGGPSLPVYIPEMVHARVAHLLPLQGLDRGMVV